MLYRILTEDKNREKVEAIVGTYFDGFTVIEATGYWKGTKEKSLVIEIWTDDNARSDINVVAKRIKEVNNQEAVLVQAFQCEGRLI
jgi:hypothetical protein